MLFACILVKDKMILIPRLVRYTRQLTAQPDDAQLISQIQSLVTSIYDYDLMLQMEAFISSITKTQKALHSPFVNPLNRSFAISHGQIYWLLVYYYMYRSNICGIMLRLWGLGITPTSSYDKTSIEEEDVRAGENICMCVEYAVNAGAGADFKVLEIRSPVTLAWGAWNRLEQRLMAQGDKSSLGVQAQEHSRQMKAYCKSTYDLIKQVWHGGDAWTANFELWAQAYTGGPPLPWLGLNRLTSRSREQE
jgi:hypothetical protein